MEQNAAQATDDRSDFLAALKYCFDAEKMIETRAAWVFLGNRRAYKLKKPITNRHFDHRTKEAREATCWKEIEVNQWLASGVYLDVCPLTASGEHLELAGLGEVVDWVIVMERLPDEALLDHIIRARTPIDWAALGTLADRLITQYRDEPIGAGDFGIYPKMLRDECMLSEEHLAHWTSDLGTDLVLLCQQALDRLERHSSEIEARERLGLIVEGHGDLRPEHICLDPAVIFDRIEFSRQYRLIDCHDEIEYLGMEAEILGNHAIGPWFRRRLEDAGMPAPSTGLLATYRLIRCLIRARLSIDHLLETHPRTPDIWLPKAARYLDVAREIASD